MNVFIETLDCLPFPCVQRELPYPNYVFSSSFKLGMLCVDGDSSRYRECFMHFNFVKGLKMRTYAMSCSLALH